MLSDVSFELYKISQIEDDQPRSGEKPAISGKTNAQGILLLRGLEENTTYYLYETETVPGYNLLTNPIVITCAGANNIKASLDAQPLSCVKVKDDSGNDVWEITVYNSTGYELPSSGGIGTSYFYLIGSIFIVLAVTGILLQQKKKKA